MFEQMRLRIATDSDVPVLARMNGELIHDEGHRNPMTVAELEARMTKWLEGGYRAVLFEESDAALGYALYRHEPEWVYLRQFFVERGRRRAGIGREALTRLMAETWKGALRVRTDVLVGNAAGIAFWRAVGFRDYCLTMESENGG